jgi:hypothetical protein
MDTSVMALGRTLIVVINDFNKKLIRPIELVRSKQVYWIVHSTEES